MLITEMIESLQKIKDEHGDIKCLLTSRYDHFEVRWIDYSNTDYDGEHACIRINDRRGE